MEREKLEQCFRITAAQTMDKEQVIKLMNEIKKMSDDDFFALVGSALGKAPTKKEEFDFMNAYLKNHNNRSGFQAVNCLLVDNMDDLLSEKIDSPTDKIFLTKKQDNELSDLWADTNEKDNLLIPSDLFFAKTIPLMDFEIQIDEREDGGYLCNARISIFKDYEKIVDSMNLGDSEAVGCLYVELLPNEVVRFPIMIIKGLDYIACAGIDLSLIKNIHYKKAIENTTMADISKLYIPWLETWYGIQIALLHPTVKTIFKNPTMVKNRNIKKRNQCNRPVKYIKHHYINKYDIKELKNPTGNYERKSLVWWVIGHWREYKDGKKVFIHGYFKGALRDTKNINSKRERQIVVPV